MYKMRPYSLRFVSDHDELSFQQEYTRRSLSYVRIALCLGAFLLFVFGPLDRMTIPSEVVFKVGIIRYAILFPSALIVLALTWRPWLLMYLQQLMSLELLFAGLGIVVMIGFAGPAAHSYYAGLILVIMFCYSFSRLRFVYAISVSLTIVAAYEFAAILIRTPVPTFVGNNFFFISANIIGAFACYNMERAIRKEFAKRHLLEAQEHETERLLLSILPAPIAERLKQAHSVIVDEFHNTTILFADIVGFTGFSSRITAQALVTYLNQIFSIMDDVADKYGLEKIKTIGDGYMLAGGIPIPRTDHAEAVADMALEVQDRIKELQPAKDGWLRIRIGIHTGPAVAGVIGRRKFSYDVWGNTVNVASRMERHSFGGCILVSLETRNLLKGNYLLVDRGNVDVKGIGEMKSFLLIGKISKTA
jgi:class 3 adenylate cyclase